MSVKRIVVKDGSEYLSIKNYSNAGNILADGIHVVNIKIPTASLVDGDQIEILLHGAQAVLFVSVQELVIGTQINIESIAAYLAADKSQTCNGYAVLTEAIATATDVGIYVTYTIEPPIVPVLTEVV
jgi:hypothetical protein